MYTLEQIQQLGAVCFVAGFLACWFIHSGSNLFNRDKGESYTMPKEPNYPVHQPKNTAVNLSAQHQQKTAMAKTGNNQPAQVGSGLFGGGFLGSVLGLPVIKDATEAEFIARTGGRGEWDQEIVGRFRK